MNEVELRHGRQRLAEVLKDNSFVSYITPQSVRLLTRDGFHIGGAIGARFSVKDGLIIWDRGKRIVAQEFTIQELVKLEKELKKVFEDIWKEHDNNN